MIQQTEFSADARSIYHAGVREALRHRWIESQKRGYDVGHEAIREWFDRYWHEYCRYRNLEHVCGEAFWEEFEAQRFGRIEQLLQSGDLLLDLILERVMVGWENLQILIWAHDWGMPVDRVVHILAQLDINSARLSPRYLDGIAFPQDS